MIVLLDHIALTPRNLAEGLSVLRSLGYQARFKCMGVAELAIKRELTTLRYGSQDLLLFDSTTGLAPGSLAAWAIPGPGNARA